MDYEFLIGWTEKSAIEYLSKNQLKYDILYTNDRKGNGVDSLIVAVRKNADSITLIVDKFLLCCQQVKE